MAVYKVKDPEGNIRDIQGPDGASDEEIITQAKALFSTPTAPAKAQPQNLAEARAAQAKTAPNIFEHALASLPSMSPKTESQLRGYAMGGADLPVGATQLVANAMGKGDAINQAIAEKETQYQQERKGAGREGFDATRFLGNLTGPAGVAAIKAAPVGTTAWRAAGVGGATGLAEPVNTAEEQNDFLGTKAKQVGIGAIGGAAGKKVADAITSTISGVKNAAAEKLMEYGITPTPGQIIGGITQRIEDAATSIPILGDAIRARKIGVIKEVNEAALNKTLAPIGEKTSKIGREGIAEVESKISDAYEKVLPNIGLNKNAAAPGQNSLTTGGKPVSAFDQEINNLKSMVATLPREHQAVFNANIKQNLMDRFTPAGLMNGATFKEVDSELGRLARQYAGDPSANYRQVGAAFREAQASLRDLMEKQNPMFADKIKAANEAWANFIRVQDASARVGSKEGVFGPVALSSAVKGSDKSLRHGSYARGEALMQDLSDAASKILPSTVPDSGTALRGLVSLGAGGGLAAVSPTALAGTAAASTLYTKPAQKVIAAVLMKRPEWATRAAEMQRMGQPIESIAAALAAQEQGRK